jgi:hypothetical protein
MLTNVIVIATTQAMALATMLRVTKWAWQGQQGRLSPTPLPPLPLSSPSLLLPTPQSLNVVALSAAIAAAVVITHLFDTTIKWRWHGQWQ